MTPRAALALLTPLLLPLLSVPAAGASAVQPAAQPAPQRDESACLGEVPVRGLDQPATDGAAGSFSDRVSCFTLTPERTAAYVVRVAVENDGGPLFDLALRDADGVLLDEADVIDVGVVERLAAGSTYTVEVARSGYDPADVDYRVSAVEVDGSCPGVPAGDWTADAEDLDLSAGTVRCRRVTLDEPGVLRVERGTAATAVIDADDRPVCDDPLGEWPSRASSCPGLDAGELRVLLGQPMSSDETATTFRALPLRTTAGCPVTPRARWGEPLPVDTSRRADGTGAECYRLTAGRSGLHDLAVWQADDWRRAVELWDVTTGALLEPRDLDCCEGAPATYDLTAGHDLRLVVAGRPFDEVDGVVTPRHPTYTAGLVDRAATEGCTDDLGDRWDSPEAERRLTRGELGCHLVDHPEGTPLRLSVRSEPVAVVDLVDAAGGVLCGERGGLSGEGGACTPVGAAPYRVLSYASTPAPTDYRLAVVPTATTAGCAPMPMATFGRELPVLATRPPGATPGAPVDCWTVTTTHPGRHEAVGYVDDGSWAFTEVYDDRGDLVGSSFGSPERGSGPGTFRVVLGGDPGATGGSYHLGVFDLGGDRSSGVAGEACPAYPDLAMGADALEGSVARGSRDCWSLPGLRNGDPLRVSVDDVPIGADRVQVVVRNAAGTRACPTYSRVGPCALRGEPPYRVVVSESYQPETSGLRESPYRVKVSDPTDRSGCLPATTAAPGAPQAQVTLAADGGTACVVVPPGPEVFWHLQTDAGEPGDAVGIPSSAIVDGGGQAQCPLPYYQGWLVLSRPCDLEGPTPYTLEVVNPTSEPQTVQLLVRADPQAETGCTPARLTERGFAPLVGTHTSALDVTCHTIGLLAGEGFGRTRYQSAGVLPDVHAFAPDRHCPYPRALFDGEGGLDVGCLADRRQEAVLLVAANAPGEYAVDVGCDDPRCPRRTPVGIAKPQLGTAAVGRVLDLSDVSTAPSDSRVVVTWSVDGEVVGRGPRFRPGRDLLGKDLSIRILANRPRRQQGRLELTRLVRPGFVRTRGQLELRGRPEVGRVLRAAGSRAVAPDDARVRYRWFRGTTQLRGVHGPRYRLRARDRGRKVTVWQLVDAPAYRVTRLRARPVVVR